jgi:hypothetical protein
MVSQSDGRKGGMGPAAAVVLVALAIPLLVFAPLIAAIVEHVTFGTDHVEDFLRRIGLHDELGLIYEPVIDFLFKLFDLS